MRENELNIRVCNRLLNKIMKRDYGYNLFFRINHINYIENRTLIPKKFHTLEQVFINPQYPLNQIVIERIKNDLMKNINLLCKVIEGVNYRQILLIELIILK